MEGFDWGNLVDVLVPAVAGMIVVAFAWGWKTIRSLVAESENTWDDKILEAFDAGYEQAKKENSAGTGHE